MGSIRSIFTGIGGLLLVASLVVGGGMAVAQDATPVASAAHPVHIHNGTCDSLDPAPLHVLSDIVATTESTGSTPVEISSTTVEATLADIANGEHAINAHESADNIETYIACGEIGALTDGSADQVAIGLRELNGSGYSGIAVLQAAGDQTDVTIYLAIDFRRRHSRYN